MSEFDPLLVVIGTDVLNSRKSRRLGPTRLRARMKVELTHGTRTGDRLVIGTGVTSSTRNVFIESTVLLKVSRSGVDIQSQLLDGGSSATSCSFNLRGATISRWDLGVESHMDLKLGSTATYIPLSALRCGRDHNVDVPKTQL